MLEHLGLPPLIILPGRPHGSAVGYGGNPSLRLQVMQLPHHTPTYHFILRVPLFTSASPQRSSLGLLTLSLSGCLHTAVLFCVTLLLGKVAAPWGALGLEAMAPNS